MPGVFQAVLGNRVTRRYALGLVHYTLPPESASLRAAQPSATRSNCVEYAITK